MTHPSTRALTRLILAVAITLIIGSGVAGFLPITIPHGDTGSVSCGPSWKPTTTPAVPAAELAMTIQRCTAITDPLGLLGVSLFAVGIGAIVGLLNARLILTALASVADAKRSDAGRINLGPRRNPQRHTS